MPTNHFGRITIVVAVLLFSLWFIFPQGNVLSPNLKPGIDMVGGTSLLYEIEPPEGGWTQPTPLSEAVMEALKKRVDPDGRRNLIWRPQGNTRLEIQMPMTAASAQNKAAREAFAAAQRALDDTNVRPAQVQSAIEDLKGPQRDARLDRLAMGSATRKALFAKMLAAYDAVSAAHAQQNAEAEAEARAQYDDLTTSVGDTNLAPRTLEDVLSLTGADRDARLKALRDKFSDFPKRLAAIDDFVGKFSAYDAVKGSIDDAASLKQLLRGSGVLEFHIIANDLDPAEVQRMVQQLKTDGPAEQAGNTTRWFEVESPDEFKGRTVEFNGKNYVLAYTTDDKSLVNREGLPRWALESATPVVEEGANVVAFQFDPQGSSLFGSLTARNINRQLGIVLDGKLISAPNINGQIPGSGIISGGGSGGFSRQEQSYLISVLNAGSLPAQLTNEPISEVTVGPQLGADNLRHGLYSCYIGLLVVGVFLIGYYYLAGLVAFGAVCMNLLMILGVMAAGGFTFTLPGIAGIVLSIGAAVDANVLIFERLREEQERGLSLNLALRNAYNKAWSAIVDSNATTVITSVVLYSLGSEEVKGFGITLLIGLVSSLFTALFVTKTVFALLIDKFGVKNLSSLPLTFPAWDRLLRPSINWMAYIWPFVGLSAVLLIVGTISFGYYFHKGELLDIDFAGGTSVQFELKNDFAMGREDVAKIIEEKTSLPSPSVVAVGTDNKTYEVDTPDTDTPDVRKQILAALGDKLNIDQPSSFDHVNQTLADAMGSAVVPIERGNADDAIKAAGFVPDDLRSYEGGAAIVLKNLNPPLSAAEIRTRLERQRLQPQAGAAQMQASRDFAVDSPAGPDEKSATAVILVADPAIPYDKDKGKWSTNLAEPAWALANAAVNQPPQFQKVNSFNAQIAGDTERDALSALVLSLVIILAYIWLRFGNFKYGNATVIAMLHDTIMVIGAIGIAHLLYLNLRPIAAVLLLEPFRLNLTLVAAILTVMSYSMIDTIVVFDRIRENRGKFGHLDRNVVNNSINQTLSRTLLTAGTNVITVFVMYVFGGPGIHGFTFVLLFGILIGTYSSIAIAAPILLISRQATGPGKSDPRKNDSGKNDSGTKDRGTNDRGANDRGKEELGKGKPVGRLQNA
jgi:SecD/SecF fusion protein